MSKEEEKFFEQWNIYQNIINFNPDTTYTLLYQYNCAKNITKYILS